MLAAIAKHIVQAAEVIGLEITLDKSYSGRGMMGKTTYAISGSERELRQALCYAAGTIDDQPENEEDPEDVLTLEDFCQAADEFKTDNMGRYDIVWY